MAESKKSKKQGRNKASCLRYRNENRRERNKLIRLRRHILVNGHTEDLCALQAAKLAQVTMYPNYKTFGWTP